MYEYLDERANLSIEYKGKVLDSYTLGIFHLNLHEITEKVALELIDRNEILGISYHKFGYRYRRINFPRHLRKVIRAEVSEITVGSLSETIKFAVLATLSDPNTRAVLQGFVGNLLFAIISSGVRGITSNIRHNENIVVPNDPFDIGSNLRDVMIALAENNPGQGFALAFRNGDTEVRIEIPGQDQENE